MPYCTYGGGHTGYNEAVPMLKYIGQFFEHEGIRVVDDIAVPGIFPEADESYNTKGRFGIITGRPTVQDLREVEGRVLLAVKKGPRASGRSTRRCAERFGQS